jgi:transcriptional regulator with XRE-family HTH domain
MVEAAPAPQEEPEKSQIINSHEEYVERLENNVCLILKRLRKKRKLTQNEITELGHFGARTYVSKVENPLGSNRTIPTLKYLERFASALNVETWRILAAADRYAGKEEPDEWLVWWHEIVPWLKRLHPKDRDAVLDAARRLKGKKTVVNGYRM